MLFYFVELARGPAVLNTEAHSAQKSQTALKLIKVLL